MAYLVRGEPAASRPEGAIEPDPSLPRACVIGAGSCGIAAAKALYEARIGFDCFEAGPVIGGLWVLDNPNDRSGAYSTLEMNTSGPRMSFSDFPLGSDDYPMHEQVRDYFERYVDHFGIRDTITFETTVERCEPLPDGRWEVTISGTGADGGHEVTHVRRDPGVQRPPLGPKAARPSVPGRLRRAADARARLPRAGAARRQQGGRGRRRQQRHGHRSRCEPGRPK